MLFPETVWRIHKRDHTVYLTFDDGPIPEVTPWVLDTLDRYGIKATFFMVGENVERHPELLQEVRRRGHSVGNHTMSHLQGAHVGTKHYLHNVFRANELIGSTLFRPPHGVLRRWTYRYMKGDYDIVFYDVITRDYNSKLKPEKVLDIVKKYTRNGSIIVFHDSLRSQNNLRWALPRAIEWLKEQGYEFKQL